jgi:two-component system sensor histidine kinase CpxA
MRGSLSRRVLGLVLLNLILIAAVLAAFAQWQFGLSVESLLLGPARDRIGSIANAIARNLDSTPYQGRAALLSSYSARYGADIFLVTPFGESLTGSEVILPPALMDRLRGGTGPVDGDDLDPEGPAAGPPGRGRGLPREKAFLTITRQPLLYWVGVRIPTPGPDGERGIPGVLLLRTNSVFNSRLFFGWRSLVLLAMALGSAALVCWVPFLRGIARSIRQMDQATEAIAEGRFDVQVTHHRGDELGHLGAQINRMAARLEGFVKHQKRFLGDIAHELCAPIARIQFALGILEQRAGDAHQADVDVLREEIQEMSALVNELLMFSKAGMHPAETPLKRVEVAAVVNRAVAQQVPGQAEWRIAVDPELAVAAHEPYLLRAISNLLRNAVRYAGDAGPITIAARSAGEQVVITVSDCGSGLPEESVDQVFAPFYRLESARTRDTGGVGLGLAIAKSCVEACRGTIACRNRQPSGLEVTITLAQARAIRT